MTTTKKYNGYLIINWKTMQGKVAKRRPRGNSPFNIVIKLDLDIAVPEYTEHECKGKVEIPQSQVSKMVLEAI